MAPAENPKVVQTEVNKDVPSLTVYARALQLQASEVTALLQRVNDMVQDHDKQWKKVFDVVRGGKARGLQSIEDQLTLLHKDAKATHGLLSSLTTNTTKLQIDLQDLIKHATTTNTRLSAIENAMQTTHLDLSTLTSSLKDFHTITKSRHEAIVQTDENRFSALQAEMKSMRMEILGQLRGGDNNNDKHKSKQDGLDNLCGDVIILDQSQNQRPRQHVQRCLDNVLKTPQHRRTPNVRRLLNSGDYGSDVYEQELKSIHLRHSEKRHYDNALKTGPLGHHITEYNYNPDNTGEGLHDSNRVKKRKADEVMPIRTETKRLLATPRTTRLWAEEELEDKLDRMIVLGNGLRNDDNENGDGDTTVMSDETEL